MRWVRAPRARTVFRAGGSALDGAGGCPGARAFDHLNPACTAGFRGRPVKILPRGAHGPRPAPAPQGPMPATLRYRPRSRTPARPVGDSRPALERMRRVSAHRGLRQQERAGIAASIVGLAVPESRSRRFAETRSCPPASPLRSSDDRARVSLPALRGGLLVSAGIAAPVIGPPCPSLAPGASRRLARVRRHRRSGHRTTAPESRSRRIAEACSCPPTSPLQSSDDRTRVSLPALRGGGLVSASAPGGTGPP